MSGAAGEKESKLRTRGCTWASTRLGRNALSVLLALGLQPLGAQTPMDALPDWPQPASGAPRESDVVFSPRFERPEAAAVARAYGATRIAWSYIARGPLMSELSRQANGHFGAAINNNVRTPDGAGVAVDFESQGIVAPWMQLRRTPWNTCAAPATMQAMRAWISRLIADGATSIHFDDAGMQFDASAWNVGDLSTHSLRGFGDWVAARLRQGKSMLLSPDEAYRYRDFLASRHGVRDTMDYVRRNAKFESTPLWRQYLRETVLDCVLDLKNHLKRVSRNNATLSLNLYTPYPWSVHAFLQPMADHVMAEISPADMDFARLQFMTIWLRQQGQGLAMVFPMSDPKRLRQGIAAAYAVGANPVVPWDVYLPPSQPGGSDSRFFGSPDDYADLYAFAASMSQFLDGWQPLARLILRIPREPQDAAAALSQIDRLAMRHVPYATCTVDDISQRCQPSVATSAGKQLVALSRSAINAATGPLHAITELDDAALKKLSYVASLPTGWQVVVKGNPNRLGDRVVHLVYQGAGPQPPSTEPLTVVLQPWVLGTLSRWQVAIGSPGSGASVRDTVTRASGEPLRIDIPSPRAWNIVRLTGLP